MSEPAPGNFYDALNAAGFEYSAYSCNGVNLFGDRKSISAAVDAFHSHAQIDTLKTQLRHWRDECGKLHAKLDGRSTVEVSERFSEPNNQSTERGRG